MSVNLTFHGAAGCVTGSCARLETPRAVILIDCGLFQGSKSLKALNYRPFPFDPAEIDAVLLTHAHVDHSGLLPKLIGGGFTGPILATAATRDLCTVMLADAGGIQESEVEHLNRRNERRGRPLIEPIYTEADGRAATKRFRKVKLGEPVAVAAGVRATFSDAGHILGAASILVEIDDVDGPLRLLFSGDIGGGGSVFVADPAAPSGVDHLILESTYGDRERADGDSASRRALLAEEVRLAHAAGGPLLIPAFAVERSQELVVDLLELMAAGDAPPGDVFLDSPLAIEASDVFQARGWNASRGVNPFSSLRPSERLHFVASPADSDGLARLRGWHVLLAASGMCDAGRIRKHLKRLLWRRETTLLLCGFQAAGTLGRLLADGAERVTIQGEEVRVRARVRRLDVYSAHADANGLVQWAMARQPVAVNVFLAHGEPSARDGLRERLKSAGFGADAMIAPELDETFVLTRKGASRLGARSARLPAGAASEPDWHNARAAFQIALGQALEHAATDLEREALLADLGRRLSAATQPPERIGAGAQAADTVA